MLSYNGIFFLSGFEGLVSFKQQNITGLLCVYWRHVPSVLLGARKYSFDTFMILSKKNQYPIWDTDSKIQL